MNLNRKGKLVKNQNLKYKLENHYNQKISEIRKYKNGVTGAFFKNGNFRFVKNLEQKGGRADQRCYAQARGKDSNKLMCPCPEDNEKGIFHRYKASHKRCNKARKKGPVAYLKELNDGPYKDEKEIQKLRPKYTSNKKSFLYDKKKAGKFITNGQDFKVLIELAGKVKEYDVFKK